MILNLTALSLQLLTTHGSMDHVSGNTTLHRSIYFQHILAHTEHKEIKMYMLNGFSLHFYLHLIHK